jgi:RNA polymerase sigma-70 factor (ECF subfamily)
MRRQDPSLVVRAAAGDGEAFAALVRPLLEQGYRLACGMLLDRTEAEDVIQEAAIKAWRKMSSLRAAGDFQTWFLTIVANQCRSVRRGRWWSVQRTEALEAPVSFDEPAANLDVQRALRRLRPDDRALLVLRYYLDLPVEQVASVLGITVAAAKSRLHRALTRIRPHVLEAPTGQS